MDFKIPKFEFKQKIHGIEVEVFNSYESDGVKLTSKLHFRSKFYIKRMGILKRWNSIESALPNLSDIVLTTNKFRFIKKEKVIIDTVEVNKVWSDGPRNYNRIKFVNIVDKRKGKAWLNLVNEMVEVTLERPLIFTNDLTEEIKRSMKIREFIYAENTRLKAQDRLNLILGKPVMEEYEEDQLKALLIQPNEVSEFPSYQLIV